MLRCGTSAYSRRLDSNRMMMTSESLAQDTSRTRSWTVCTTIRVTTTPNLHLSHGMNERQADHTDPVVRRLTNLTHRPAQGHGGWKTPGQLPTPDSLSQSRSMADMRSKRSSRKENTTVPSSTRPSQPSRSGSSLGSSGVCSCYTSSSIEEAA